MKIEIIIKDKAYVYTPYNAEFVAAIKGIGGARWNRDKGAWGIPSAAVDQCREIMKEVYGETDLPSGEDKKTIQLTFTEEYQELRTPITMFGKTIASAYGRDSGAKVGSDVAFIYGSPASGGSVKNWTTVVPKDSVVVLYNVPESLLAHELPSGVAMDILEISINKEALEAEREKLLARLAEIERLLS